MIEKLYPAAVRVNVNAGKCNEEEMTYPSSPSHLTPCPFPLFIYQLPIPHPFFLLFHPPNSPFSYIAQSINFQIR